VDSVRDYAGELAAERLTAAEREAAVTRLLDHYVHTAALAMDLYLPASRSRRPRVPPPTGPIPPLPDATAALAWLGRERTALAAAARRAGRVDPRQIGLLAATVAEYLSIDGHYAEATELHTAAGCAARRAGDQAGEAAALASLGLIDAAREMYQRVLACYQSSGDRAGEITALNGPGQH
jgi:hypothetical protein